jgi:large subunit ribosomal protein L25
LPVFSGRLEHRNEELEEMLRLTVESQIRQEFGKNANRRLRAAGRVPGIVYGRNLSPVAVSVDPKDLDRILHSDTGHNTIFTLKYEDQATDVLIRELQRDPVGEELLHADFIAVSMDRTMIFDVPVEIVGTAAGVKMYGGILDLVLREIHLECLPGNLPDHIRIDVTDLEIGDSVRVEQLEVDTDKVTILSDPDLTILTIAAPLVETSEDQIMLDKEAAEPEIAGGGQPEGSQPGE